MCLLEVIKKICQSVLCNTTSTFVADTWQTKINAQKIIHTEFIVDEVLTSETSKICNSLCEILPYNHRNLHESGPLRSSRHFNQIDFNDCSMLFIELSR